MYIFYAHGGSDNHGCEAIIRGTCENLTGNKLLYSSNAKADNQYNLNEICVIRPDTYKRYYHPVKWFLSKVYTTLFHKNSLFKLVDGKEKGIYLSVGGDNYCYLGLIDPVLKANERIRSKGNKSVLWGTSIEEDVLDNPRILDDISKYDFIFARETLTYNALVKHGLKVKTYLYPDPAFAMRPQKNDSMKEIFKKEVVGINISPMILKFDNNNLIVKGYVEIIQYLLENTDTNILLIPHVVKRNNDDRDAIRKLTSSVQNDRIFVLNDMSANELKYVISKCSFFLGARTHSTIAAYSTCVPTMVVGYSIKARGIAKDIFGTDTDYVVDVRELEDASVLMKAFIKLYLDKTIIKRHLDAFMPEYINKTKDAVDQLIELVWK